ncbi:hybrid sensor histidine kinase/response regulator [Paracidovorax sp. MALMAid1276]|uniref:ATP-binding response regulator n=1 Tax=Paracidovorax sp. MALMAid1276 TaxID=3411631 RepID=UPI003B9C1EAC
MKAPDAAAPSDRVFADSIGSLSRALRGSVVSNLVAASLLAWAMHGGHPAGVLAAWLAGLALVHTWRPLLRAVLRQSSSEPLTAARKARRVEVDALILAAYWGASSVMFFHPGSSLEPFYWALVLGGTAAGSIGAHAHHPRVMWIFLPTLIAPFALRALLESDSDSRFLGAGMLLLLVYLLYYGKQHARTLQRMIALRHENSALVEELQSQAHALREANAAKSRFFAAASHDLRQPLQAMGLYLSVLQGDGPTLARMGECMDSLDRLLAQVMDLSRLDSGQTTAHPEPVALQPLLQRLADTYEAAARKKGLQLRVHPTTAWAQSDPLLLERVLANLLTNAIRYTEHGGVLLGVRRAGAGLRLCVVDTGIGIPNEAYEAVFEEFVQLNNAERNPERGHGLGLPTVRRIAALLGHPVGLRSRVGRGSVFSLDLPSAKPSDAPAPRAQPAAAGRLQGRVLVVEDNSLVRDALLTLLEGWGLEVTTAPDAPGALLALRTTAFDAVLSDWRLPGAEDGLAVLRQAGVLQPGLKLAAMITGEDTQRMAEAQQDFPVLRKPVRPLRLRALLERYLREHKAP